MLKTLVEWGNALRVLQTLQSSIYLTDSYEHDVLSCKVFVFSIANQCCNFLLKMYTNVHCFWYFEARFCQGNFRRKCTVIVPVCCKWLCYRKESARCFVSVSS